MIILLSFATVGERDKFIFLYENYKNLMLSKAYGILHDRSLAEDVVSDAYIRLYKNIHKIDDPASGKSVAFLSIIVRNLALSMLAHEKSTITEELDIERTGGYDVEPQVMSKLAAEEILLLVDSLEEKYRSVFLLNYAYGYAHKDIGDLLGISENNVTVRLHRARKKLAQLVEKEGYARG